MNALELTSFYITVLDKIPAAIVATNKNGDIIYYNKAAEIFMGFTQKLYKQEWLQYFELYSPDGKKKIEKHNHPIFKTLRNEMIVNEEFLLTPKNKIPKTVAITTHALMVNELKGGALTIIQNITDQKETEKKLNSRSKSLMEAYEGLRRAEASLKTTNTELEKRVLERTQNLTKINKELQSEIKTRYNAEQKIKKSNIELTKTNNDLDNFIYTASHDLRAPISNIEGLINALKEEEAYCSAHGNIKQLIDMIYESVDKFKTTISDLTEISKIQKGGDDLVEELKFEDILKDTERTILQLIRTNNAKIEYDFSACDSIRLSRKNLKSIFYNLLSNAIKYRHKKRPPFIKITTMLDASHCIFKISDNGMGIPEVRKNQIFLMFKRFHDHVEGSGVGLYLVKRIIENAGGQIEVQSKVDEGTTFTIYFPLK